MAGLWRVNGDLLQGGGQAQNPVTPATLDMDATLIETHKRPALYCYKHFKAYQPLNTWWAEQGPIVHSPISRILASSPTVRFRATT